MEECSRKDQFNIHWTGWRDGILLKMFKMQQQGILCDTRLVSKDGDVINVHSPVLSAACPLFENIIIDNLGHDFEVTFHDLSKHVLGMMVEFLYLGSTKAAWSEMCQLFEAARGLSLTELVEACAQCMNSTDVVKPKKSSSSRVFDVQDIKSVSCDVRRPISDVISNMCDIDRSSRKPSLSSSGDKKGLRKDVQGSEKDDEQRDSTNTRMFKLEKNESELHKTVKCESQHDEESIIKRSKFNPHDVEENYLQVEKQETIFESNMSSYVEYDVGEEVTVSSECGEDADPTTVTVKQFNDETEKSPKNLINMNREGKGTGRNAHFVKKPSKPGYLEQKIEPVPPLQSLSNPNSERKEFSLVSCPVCKETYENIHSMQSHKCSGVDGQTDTKRFACSTCGKRFAVKCNMQAHERIHTGEKPFVCDICGKSFSHKSNFLTHRKLHSGLKPFACDDCDKTFVSKRSLITHKRYHSGERPYACDKCPKTFLEKTHLNKHKWLHSSDRPYKCALCGKGFVQRVHCRNHLLYSHTGSRKTVKT